MEFITIRIRLTFDFDTKIFIVRMHIAVSFSTMPYYLVKL
jgi:hypothetical protein